MTCSSADRTSNDAERKNREFRKRQKGHYRLRSLDSLFALLDLILLRPFRRIQGLPSVFPTLRLKASWPLTEDPLPA